MRFIELTDVHADKGEVYVNVDCIVFMYRRDIKPVPFTVVHVSETPDEILAKI